jgi:hypothetical protein
MIRVAVAHHADCLHRQQHRERLPDRIVEAGFADLVDVDGIGLAEDVKLFAVMSPGQRMARPGPGNGWRPTKASGRPSSRPT